MQPPTVFGVRVRSTTDAMVIFHAVSLGILPIISRRLDNEERRAISSGCVYVWEERGSQSEATGLGIERWTDGIRWGPSRVRDEFLFYHEKGTTSSESMDHGNSSESDVSPTLDMHPPQNRSHQRDTLVKQTYSIFLLNEGRRKWHMIAYFTQGTVDRLRTVDDLPELASISVPVGAYAPARCSKGRLRSGSRRVSFTGPSTSTQAYPRPSATTGERFEEKAVRGVGRPPPPSAYTHPASSYFLDPAMSSNPPLPSDSWRGESRSIHLPASVHTDSRHHLTHGAIIGGSGGRQQLAPLEYLQNLTPPRRLPCDEKALSVLFGNLSECLF